MTSYEHRMEKEFRIFLEDVCAEYPDDSHVNVIRRAVTDDTREAFKAWLDLNDLVLLESYLMAHRDDLTARAIKERGGRKASIHPLSKRRQKST